MPAPTPLLEERNATDFSTPAGDAVHSLEAAWVFEHFLVRQLQRRRHQVYARAMVIQNPNLWYVHTYCVYITQQRDQPHNTHAYTHRYPRRRKALYSLWHAALGRTRSRHVLRTVL